MITRAPLLQLKQRDGPMMQRPLANTRAYSFVLFFAHLSALSFVTPLLSPQRAAAAPATELRIAPLRIANHSQLPPEELSLLETALWEERQ